MCQRDYPPGYEDYVEFVGDRERVERLGKKIPKPAPMPDNLGPGSAEDWNRFLDHEARKRWDSVMAETNVVNVPAKRDWRVPGYGALLGVTGAGLLYGVGAVIAWTIRGFKGS